METALSVPQENTIEQKLKKIFGKMIVYKSAENAKFISAMNLPSYIRDWLNMRFSAIDGTIDVDKVTEYVRHTIPSKEQWNSCLVDMMYENKTIKILAKVRIEFDTKKKKALFSLPMYNFPPHKGEAVVDWAVLEQNRSYLLSSTEIQGILTIECAESDTQGDNIFRLIKFVPFCPYTINLDYYKQARRSFTVEEWIDVILGAVDYSPSGYSCIGEKLAVLKRLLPFVEKRLNLIELAPKETGKSYMFSQLSQYGWLVSGGNLSRAKMFYDISKKTHGLVSCYDYVAMDEIQSVRFTDPMEMQGALKGYLESGEYRVGDYRGIGSAGFVLLGNISMNDMDVKNNMFRDLPEIFQESALIDRFHGFIKGWEIPKMKENMKASGWALNTEYFTEIMHLMRDEPVYRSVVDRLLILPENSATRDTEAIKRICTGFMKLLFPNVTDVSHINIDEFEMYCLKPAMEMRSVIKSQLTVIDPEEFGGTAIPEITVRREI